MNEIIYRYPDGFLHKVSKNITYLHRYINNIIVLITSALEWANNSIIPSVFQCIQ